MTRCFIILLSLLCFASCSSNESAEETSSTEAKAPELVTLNDHLLFVSDYFNRNELETTNYEDVKASFQIGDLVSNYSDSLTLENTVLLRNFYFEGNQLKAVKYASYSDSAQMVLLKSQFDELNPALTALLGNPIQSTINASKWVSNQTSFKLKTFPKEGVDLVISSVNTDTAQTSCVGDWYKAESTLTNTIKGQLKGTLSLDTLSPEKFDGITLSAAQNQLFLTYDCPVSKKLIWVDTKSIVSALNAIFGSKPEIKDGMYFWTYPQGQIQLDVVHNGYTIQFIL